MTNLLLKFHASKENLPDNGQAVVYLCQGRSFGISDVSLASCTVYYLATDGESSWCINDGDTFGDNDVVGVYIGHKDATQQNIWWIDEEEYWQQFDVADAELEQVK